VSVYCGGSERLVELDFDAYAASLQEVGFASGMTDAERDDIWKHRDEYLGRVVDISAQEVTKDGRLRHPRFLRFRDDVSPETLTMEKLRDDAKLARRASKE
jgi:ATP-dependent DNA ligase